MFLYAPYTLCCRHAFSVPFFFAVLLFCRTLIAFISLSCCLAGGVANGRQCSFAILDFGC